MFKQTFQVIS